MHRMIRVLPLLTFAGCATGVPETVLPARIAYQCGGGKVLPVERSPDGRQALVHVEGRAVKSSPPPGGKPTTKRTDFDG